MTARARVASTRRAALSCLAVLAALAGAGCGSSSGGAAGPGAGQPPAASDAGVQPASARATPSVPRGRVTRLTGGGADLSRYRGDAVLVVNTASECGFTPQFKGLEALYRQRRADGLVLLGLPSDDFAQELDSDAAVARFCKQNYGSRSPCSRAAP